MAVLLSYPWYSQLTYAAPDAAQYRNDCGPISCKMIIAGTRGNIIPGDTLSARTGLAVNDVGLNNHQLVALLKSFGVKASVVQNVTVGLLREWLSAGRAAIALVNYSWISKRWDASFGGGHFFVVVGCDDAGNFLVNDPDWLTVSGKGFKIPQGELDASLRYSPIPRECVLVEQTGFQQLCNLLTRTEPENLLQITVKNTTNSETGTFGVFAKDLQSAFNLKYVPPVQPAPNTIAVYPIGDKTNVRASAKIGIATNILFTVNRGDELQVLNSPVPGIGNNLKWYEVVKAPVPFSGKAHIAMSVVTANKPTVNPKPPAVPTAQRSGPSIGLHFAGGSVPGSLFEHLRRAADRGTPVPIVTVVNDGGLANRIKATSPKTVVVFRPGVFGGAEPDLIALGMSGRQWFERRLAQAQGVNYDYLQCLNEWRLRGDLPLAEAKLFAQKYIEIMDAATSAGKKVTVIDAAPGNIEAVHFSAIQPVLEQAERQGHMLNYHSYSDQNDTYSMKSNELSYAMRWKRFVVAGYTWSWTTKNLPNLKIGLLESGSFKGPRFTDVDTALRMMREHHDQLKPYPQVVGASWWTLASDDPQWRPDLFDAALNSYFEWIETLK